MDGMTLLAIVGAIVLIWPAYMTLAALGVLAIRTFGWLGRWLHEWNRS